MKIFLIVFCFIANWANSQDVKYSFYTNFVKDSLPLKEENASYSNQNKWYNTISINDSIFVYNSLDLDIDFYGDSLVFDLHSIEYHHEDHVRLLGQHHYKKLDKGWLIGTNKGEWGGSLFWVEENQKDYKYIANANVNKIFNWEGKTVVLEGVSHINISEGYLIEVHTDLTLDTLVVFPESPYNAVVGGDNVLYVVTDFILYKVDKTGIYTQLYDFSDWPQLNSDLTYSNNQLYLGMLNGVARFDLKENTIEWFKFKNE